jgi:hypothetical protein
MRAGDLGNPMPSHPCEVHILDALAVDMNFIIFLKTSDPFSDSPLGSVALVNEG